MASLSRVEAIERAALLEVHRYRVELDLTTDSADFSSRTTIAFSARTPGRDTFLDVKAEEILRITLNGNLLDPTALLDGRFPLTGLAADNELIVEARMRYSSDGEGLHRHVDPADGNRYLYAMSFLDAGPRWFASFDQPDLKASYTLEVLCPPDWSVIGNGPARQLAPGRWQIVQDVPLSTYFVTLAAGPYHRVIAEHDGIVLGVHARASLAEFLEAEAPEMLEVTRLSFDRLHAVFGIRYPFGEYHQVFCPDFNAGAMENPGCVTLRDQYVFRAAATSGERGVRANTIAHEMAHMWFGDLVTMRWWDDLWLNESFAEYMAHRVCAEVTDYDAWTEFGSRRKDWGYVADQSPSTHPVAGNGSADAAAALADFDGISYAKGASVLKQLAAYLGDEVFFTGLRSYFDRHRYGNAEFSDLIRAWSEAAGRDVAEWARRWLTTTGLDTLTATLHDGAGDGTVAGAGGRTAVLQRRSPDSSDRPHTVVAAGYAPTGDRTAEHPVTLAGTAVELTFPSETTLVVADARDDSWAKVRFGDGWSGWSRAIAGVADPVTRVVLHNSVRDGVRDGELDPALALDLLLTAARAERSDLMLTDLLGFAIGPLAGQYLPAEARPAAAARIGEVSTGLLADSAPGGDLQLVAARAWIRVATEIDTLTGWLAAENVPPGLSVDSELRWEIVVRLAGLGAVDEQAIADELERDPTSSGAVHAATARAARPDAGAKAEAWRLLTQPSALSAYELYATAEGFFLTGQESVTDPYVARFFAEMPDTVSHRSGWALSRLVTLGYPRTSSTPSTLVLARAALDRVDLDSGVRRALVDATDQLRRAVDSQRRFAPAMQ